MPLIKSDSKEAIAHNIKVEREHGKPEKQAIAIAEQTARDAKSSHHKAKETSLAQELSKVIHTKYRKR